MADFHHRHANARKAQHVALSFFQDWQRQNGRAGTEVMYSFRHSLTPQLVNGKS
jgi:hypothetical protein